MDIRLVVILSLVLFHRFENTSATEGIAQTVDESPTRPRIFEGMTIVDAQQFRLTSGHVLLGIHQGDHRCQPVRRHLDVRIQQQEILGLYLSERLVIPLGKAPVLVQLNQPDGRIIRPQHRQRTVGRSIIRHIHRRLVLRILQY